MVGLDAWLAPGLTRQNGGSYYQWDPTSPDPDQSDLSLTIEPQKGFEPAVTSVLQPATNWFDLTVTKERYFVEEMRGDFFLCIVSGTSHWQKPRTELQ